MTAAHEKSRPVGGGFSTGSETSGQTNFRSDSASCLKIEQADDVITFTTFPDVGAKTKRSHSMSWGVFVEQMRKPKTYANKKVCPLLAFAEFGDVVNPEADSGSLKHGGNVMRYTGAVGDCDGGRATFAEVVERARVANIKCVVYTTGSHTTAHPRLRVVAPFMTPCNHAGMVEMAETLNGALGGVLDSESVSNGQGFFFGRVAGVIYEAEAVDGARIDDGPYLFTTPIPVSKKSAEKGVPATDDNEAGLLAIDALPKPPLEVIASAAGIIPNDGVHEHAVRGWLEWRDLLWAIKDGAGDAGYSIAQELSLRHPKCNQREFDHQWNRRDSRKTGPKIGIGTLLARAKECGWVDPRHAVRDGLDGCDAYDDLEDRSDTGNAALLRKFAGGDMRYVVEREVWMCWTNGRWQVDDTGSLAQGLALRVGKHYTDLADWAKKKSEDANLDAAGKKKLESVAKGYKDWATKCRNKTQLTNMLAIASRDARMVVRAASLDRGAWLFGVDNGVVDLRTGELRTAGRDDLVTKRAPFAFHPLAPAPRWREFVDEITGAPIEGEVNKYEKRPGLAAYVQRMCGYLMTGGTPEQKMFIAHGKGSNGKNVLLDIMQEVMGDYCVTIPSAALMATRNDDGAEKPSSVAATLAGARAAISSESKEGQKLDVALVKLHTGGGFMNARLMRENSFRFAISHKLVLMTNHRPTLDHMDEAVRGRLHMVPFDRIWNRPGHPDPNPAWPDGDKGLMDALRREREGVLAWLIEGAVLYFRDGLEPPAEVTKSTRDYFATEDDFGRWLEQMERCEPKAGQRASDLFNQYTSHCINSARRPSFTTQTAFSIELKKRGVQNKPLTNGTFYGLIYGGLVGSGGLSMFGSSE